MAKQNIGVGSGANAGNGDTLRDAFIKVNSNFTELYGLIEGAGGNTTVTVADAPPVSPTSGSLWWNTEDGKIYVYYSGAWIDTSSAPMGVDRLISGSTELVLNTNGSLSTPLLLPKTFTATLDVAHMVNPVALTDSNLWHFEVQFQVNPNGEVETIIGNSTPWGSNPGYVTGMEFQYTEADHGIPGYTFSLSLTDVQHPGDFMWSTNLAASPPPSYPSTITTLGAIKLTSNGNDWILGTDGFLTLPGGAKITANNSNVDLVAGTGGWSELASNNGDSFVWVDDNGAYVVTNGSTNFRQWSFGADGTFTFPETVGFNLIWNSDTAGVDDAHLDQVTVSNTHVKGLTIKNTVSGIAHEWVFDKDKKLKLPAGGDIVDSTGTSVLGGNNTGLIGFVDDTIYDLNGVIIENADLSHGATAALLIPTNGSSVAPIQLNNTYGDIALSTGSTGIIANTWTFGRAGALTFPDSTVQQTAYQTTTAPTSSKGVSGNKAGMVAFDTGNFYYCKQDYTDGAADIWVKTAWTSTSW